MDATSEISLPTSQPSDSSDVQVALATAQSLWGQDPREALRWLRKAAEGAADAGDDLRSVQLARAAADLRNHAGIAASLAPAALSAEIPASAAASSGAGSVGTGSSGSGTVLVGGAAAGPSGAAASSNPYATEEMFSGNPAQTVPATPAAAAAAALQQASIAAQALGSEQAAIAAQQAATAQQAAQQAAAVAAQQAIAAQHAAAQQAALAAQQAASQQAAAQAAQQAVAQAQAAQQAAAQQAAAQAHAAQAQAAQLAQTVRHTAAGRQNGAASSPVSSATPLEIQPVSQPPSSLGFITHRTVRVALSPTPNGRGEFSVHPLAEGEPTPAGWKDALLVALEPSERLFPGRN
jgi:hypothetical protein